MTTNNVTPTILGIDTLRWALIGHTLGSMKLLFGIHTRVANYNQLFRLRSQQNNALFTQHVDDLHGNHRTHR